MLLYSGTGSVFFLTSSYLPIGDRGSISNDSNLEQFPCTERHHSLQKMSRFQRYLDCFTSKKQGKSSRRWNMVNKQRDLLQVFQSSGKERRSRNVTDNSWHFPTFPDTGGHTDAIRTSACPWWVTIPRKGQYIQKCALTSMVPHDYDLMHATDSEFQPLQNYTK